MSALQHSIRLLRHGRSQILQIPREFELDGNHAILRKDGDRLTIEPVRKGRLLGLLRELEPLEEVFPEVDEGLLPLEPSELTG